MNPDGYEVRFVERDGSTWSLTVCDSFDDAWDAGVGFSDEPGLTFYVSPIWRTPPTPEAIRYMASLSGQPTTEGCVAPRDEKPE